MLRRQSVRQRRFKLEDARRAPRPQQLVHFGIVQVGPLESIVTPWTLRDHLRRVVQHGQRLQTQEIDLQHSDLFDAGHVVLGDDRVGIGFGIGRRADGDVVGERPGRDDDARAVHRRVARQASMREPRSSTLRIRSSCAAAALISGTFSPLPRA